MSDFRVSFKNIQNGKFLPAYLLLGAETLLKEEWMGLLFRNFLREESETKTGIRRVEGKDTGLPEILAELDMPVLFSDGKKIVIIDNPPYLPSPPKDKKKKNADQEEQKKTKSKDAASEDKEKDKKLIKVFQAFWDKQSSLAEPEHIIIFRVIDADKRKRFFKMLSNDLKAVVDCSPLQGDSLQRWVRNRLKKYNKTIDAVAYEKLLLYTGGDLWRIDREIAKISDYMHEDEERITEELVEKLVYGGPQGNIFNLVDALGDGAYSQAFSHLEALFALGESPVMILFMIVRQYRLILNALSLRDEGCSQSNAASALGVMPFIARKIYGQAGNYGHRELREIFRILQETDFNIKTGKMEPVLALELLIGRISGLISERQIHYK